MVEEPYKAAKFSKRMTLALMETKKTVAGENSDTCLFVTPPETDPQDIQTL